MVKNKRLNVLITMLKMGYQMDRTFILEFLIFNNFYFIMCFIYLIFNQTICFLKTRYFLHSAKFLKIISSFFIRNSRNILKKTRGAFSHIKVSE